LVPGAGLAGGSLQAQEGAQAESQDSKPAALARGAADYFTDVQLVDHNGQPQRLYSDLLQGKVVIINAMFTACSGACPVMSARLQKVQDWLGDRLGRDAYILSISVDSQRDTPEILNAYAKGFEAKPGWFFLTGDKANVDFALKKLGQYVDVPDNHMSVIIIGNEPSGLWKKAMGLAPAESLIAVLESVMEDRG
jgi:protein SCO1/2